MVQNSCRGSSVVLDCVFNPGHVAEDFGIDANISSQNTSICKSQDSLKYPIADCRGSCDFLPGERKPGYLSGKRHKEYNEKMKVLRVRYLAGLPSSWHNAQAQHSFFDIVGFIAIAAPRRGDDGDVYILQGVRVLV